MESIKAESRGRLCEAINNLTAALAKHGAPDAEARTLLLELRLRLDNIEFQAKLDEEAVSNSMSRNERRTRMKRTLIAGSLLLAATVGPSLCLPAMGQDAEYKPQANAPPYVQREYQAKLKMMTERSLLIVRATIGKSVLHTSEQYDQCGLSEDYEINVLDFIKGAALLPLEVCVEEAQVNCPNGAPTYWERRPRLGEIWILFL